MLLCDMHNVIALKGVPRVVCYPESDSAGSLTVQIRSTFYGAATLLHDASTVVISGSAYNVS